jgi:phosphohistidine phosphatase
MKVLYLLRHAKSSWKDNSLADYDRPLNGRGRRAAKVMGGYLDRYMSSMGPPPDLVLCSTAARTRETLNIVQDNAPRTVGGGNVKIEFDDGLYHAAPMDLLGRLQRLADHVGVVLLIGHNPGLEHLALGLTEEHADCTAENVSGKVLLGRMAIKFPTAALAVLETEIKSWRYLKAGGAMLRQFIRPKDLAD